MNVSESDSALGLLLDAVVTDSRRRVERLGDLAVVDQRLAGGGSALHRIVNPRPGVAVGLQLEGDSHQPLGLPAGLLDGGVLPREVLHVVAELVGDDVGSARSPGAPKSDCSWSMKSRSMYTRASAGQ